MKAVYRWLLGTALMALAFLAGVGFRNASAQQRQIPDWVAQQVNLPPDIHPETLSRVMRMKATDFTDEEEKRIFIKVNDHPGSKQLVSKWLGPTGIRLQIPKYADAIDNVGASLQNSGVDPKYHELTVAVVTRETGNRDEFLNHHADA